MMGRGCIPVVPKHGRFVIGLLLVLVVRSHSVMAGEPAPFRSQELVQPFDDVLTCDLDGNGLDDITLIVKERLIVHLHRAGEGVSPAPNAEYVCSDGPAVVWPARLRPAQGVCLLVMTAHGVSALTYASGQFAKTPLIDGRTILPDQAPREGPPIVVGKLSAGTRERQTTIFVPTNEGLELWREQEGRWCKTQVLKAVDSTAELACNGTYLERAEINLSIGDWNADGWEDLMTRCVVPGQDKAIFRLYPQTPDGTFGPEPRGQLQTANDPYTWFGFADLDRDGQVDLLKGVWTKEPSFLPGTYSGRVVVMVERPLAAGGDRESARQYFRKSDWCPSVPVVDVDGDGLLDLVLGTALLSVREDVRKALLSFGFDHNLKIYFNRKEGGYPRKPDCQKDVVIRFDTSSVPLSWTRKDYLDRLMTLDGDFNGDGKRDLLIRDRFREASVYFFKSRQAGFSQQADVTFPAEHVERFTVTDLNRDGISDLLVAQTSPRLLRIFLSGPKR